MKMAFIVSGDDGQYGLPDKFTQCRIFPPVSLARMAGLAGACAKVILIDERIKTVAHDEYVDIALIFVNKYNQGRALELAGVYQRLGSHVILTGPVINDAPEKYSKNADCLFYGAGEDNLPLFLEDYKRGKTRRLYMSRNRVASTDQIFSIEGNDGASNQTPARYVA